uniref:Uncharacterized protein n=1 Tax=viral metagenome TaxID=1070528 RepID=A0A6C0DH15_9ZZZZ
MKKTLHKKYNRQLNKDTKNKHSKTKKNTMKGKKEKWETAIEAARATLKETGSLEKAKIALNRQALINARKLFGPIGHI